MRFLASNAFPRIHWWLWKELFQTVLWTVKGYGFDMEIRGGKLRSFFQSSKNVPSLYAPHAYVCPYLLIAATASKLKTHQSFPPFIPNDFRFGQCLCPDRSPLKCFLGWETVYWTVECVLTISNKKCRRITAWNTILAWVCGFILVPASLPFGVCRALMFEYMSVSWLLRCIDSGCITTWHATGIHGWNYGLKRIHRFPCVCQAPTRGDKNIFLSSSSTDFWFNVVPSLVQIFLQFRSTLDLCHS